MAVFKNRFYLLVGKENQLWEFDEKGISSSQSIIMVQALGSIAHWLVFNLTILLVILRFYPILEIYLCMMNPAHRLKRKFL